MSPQRDDVIEAVFEIPSDPCVTACFELPKEPCISAIFEINTYIDAETAEEFLEKYIYPLQDGLADEIERSTTVDEELSEEIDSLADEIDGLANEIDTLDVRVENVETEVAHKIDDVVGGSLINTLREGNTVTVSSSTFTFEQATPSKTWEIHHNLNKRPSIQLAYYSGESFEGYREYIDNNNIIIRLENEATGYAYLN